MAPNATAARGCIDTTRVYLDASAVFGALEIIGECELDDVTAELNDHATSGARLCLSMLGLTPEDLAHSRRPAGASPQGCALQRGDPCGIVVPLRPSVGRHAASRLLRRSGA
jgi:hypothetical protein